MRLRPLIPFVLCALLGAAWLSACAPPPPKPRNLAESIAQAHVLLQETADATGRAMAGKIIGPEQANRMLNELMAASDGLFEARRLLEAGDIRQTEAQLRLAEAIILRIRDEAAKGGAQ